MILQNNERTPIKKYVFSGSLLTEYSNYSETLDLLDISNDTKEWRLKHIRGFLHFLEEHGNTIDTLEATLVYDYLSSIQNLSSRTKEHRAVCIRLFLNWLHDNNKIKFKGTQILPTIKCNKKENIITYYSNDEITKLINAIDVDTDNGKRDLAIILLISYLGLRTSDVRFLKLENIKWNENRIVIIHNKNNVINSFYMPHNLRYALIDYIKNCRKDSLSDYVFNENSNSILERHKIYNIINRYFKIANIDTKNKKHGPHSLRHSLATSLLNEHCSIYEISSVLGHQNINDTMVYTSVNLKQLKRISLEVTKW